MVNYETFCPFERIIALLKKAGLNAKASILSVDFHTFGIYRQYDLTTSDGAKLYFDAEVSLNARKAFMNMKEVPFTFSYDGDTYQGIVKNILYKKVDIVSEFKGQKPVLNTVGNVPSFYKEALEITIGSNQVTRLNSHNECSEFTPYYNYVVSSSGLSTDKTLVIYGPAVPEVKTSVFQVESSLGPVEVFVDAEKDIQFDLQPVKLSNEDVEQLRTVKPVLIIKVGDFEQPLIPGQTRVILGAVPIRMEHLLALYKIGVYLEYCINNNVQVSNLPFENGQYICEMERVGDYFILNKNFMDFYYKDVLKSEYVSDVFKDISFTENSIDVIVDNSPVKLIYEYSQAATFAVTLAYFISMLVDGSLTSFFTTIKTLVSRGGFAVVYDSNVKGFIFEGRSDKVWNGESITIKTMNGPAIVSGKLDRITEIPDHDGFIICGFDNTSINRQPGPDQYFVVYVKSGRLFSVYDPISAMTNFKVGTDITSIFLSTKEEERVLYHIEQPVVSSWLNKTGVLIA